MSDHLRLLWNSGSVSSSLTSHLGRWAKPRYMLHLGGTRDLSPLWVGDLYTEYCGGSLVTLWRLLMKGVGHRSQLWIWTSEASQESAAQERLSEPHRRGCGSVGTEKTLSSVLTLKQTDEAKDTSPYSLRKLSLTLEVPPQILTQTGAETAHTHRRQTSTHWTGLVSGSSAGGGM